LLLKLARTLPQDLQKKLVEGEHPFMNVLNIFKDLPKKNPEIEKELNLSSPDVNRLIEMMKLTLSDFGLNI
jgi:hypothetical protein